VIDKILAHDFSTGRLSLNWPDGKHIRFITF
jgi:hypothetical protein